MASAYLSQVIMKLTKQILTYTFPKESLLSLSEEMSIIIHEKENNGWRHIHNGEVEEVNYSFLKITLSFERDYEE